MSELDNILATATNKATATKAAPPAPIDWLAKMESTYSRLKSGISKEIKFPPPLVNTSERLDAVMFPNTINVVKGKTGAFKSRITAAFCSALLNQAFGASYAGLRRNIAPGNVAVIYVDTERSLGYEDKVTGELYASEFAYSMQNIIKRADAKLEADGTVKNFRYHSIKGVPRDQRLDVIQRYLLKRREEFPDTHLFVCLDVVSDCIENFNDVKQSLRFVDFLTEMIDDHNCTFLCVIHENPGLGDKARGNLGTELENKASLVMQVSREKNDGGGDDLIKLKFSKIRMSAPPEPIYLWYNPDLKDLVVASLEQARELQKSRERKVETDDLKKSVVNILCGYGDDTATKTVLFDAIRLDLRAKGGDVSERTISDRLKAIMEAKEIFINAQGKECELKKTMLGKEAAYRLVERELELAENTSDDEDDVPF